MNKELKNIFENGLTINGVTVPIAHLKYNGKSETYVVWTIIDESPQLCADDEPIYSVAIVDIDVYSPQNYTAITAAIKRKMKENDWIWVEDSSEMYEDDTKTYHKTITFQKECAI